MKLKSSTKRRIRKGWRKTLQLPQKALKFFPWAILIGLVLIIVFWAMQPQRGPAWTGFGEYLPSAPGSQSYFPAPERAKTLWDWMELLLVPFSLGIAAVLVNHGLQKRQEEKEKDQVREQALLVYFKEISNLLLEHNLYTAAKEDDVRFIAMAHSNNILGRLDGQRKGLVLNFLRSLDLMTCSISPDWKLVQADNRPRPIVAITKSDLSNLNLPRGLWRGPQLSKVYITNCEFSDSDLSETDLSQSFLTDSWFHSVNFKNANLSGCNFSRSVFIDVNLEGADLTNANLTTAIILPEDLKKAKSLEGCLMIDGEVYDHQKSLEAQGFEEIKK